ncbi:MAG: hypothetical protein STHCBS139747_004951 [Sporothrix thermara]
MLTGGRHRLFTESPGCSDRAYNMLCLSPSLHTWWARGYFALRCLEVMPVQMPVSTSSSSSSSSTTSVPGGIVRMQLVWLPRQTPSALGQRPWLDAIDLADFHSWISAWDARPRYGSSVTEENTGVDQAVLAVPHPETSRLLQSGQVFEVAAQRLEDAEKMKAMLDFQWACLQIASLSGAAGDPDFLFDSYNGDYDGTIAAARAAALRAHSPYDDGVYFEDEFTAD